MLASPCCQSASTSHPRRSLQVGYFGLKAVRPHAPTLPLVPYLVRHDVRDNSGRAAATRVRRFYVRCREAQQRACERDGVAVCSDSAEVCLPSGGGPQAAAAATPLPRVTLLGPAEVEVAIGAPYGRCPDGAPLATVCDRGATAIDSVEGDITAQIQVPY